VRQNFRLNETDHYTVFDLPIMVTNRIDADDARPGCDSLTNELLTPEEVDAVAANEIGILFAPDSSTEVDFEDATGKGPEENPQNGGGNGGSGGNRSGSGDDDGNGNGNGNGDSDSDEDGNDGNPSLGGQRPEAGPEVGLGGAGMLEISWAALVAAALFGML
jgi:hypothetical protein